jgi:hypothetical protein
MVDLTAQVEQQHQEFLELLASGSNSQYSDTASVVCPVQTYFVVMFTGDLKGRQCFSKERQVGHTRADDAVG